ncbi:carbohydrate kinase family protein [Shimia haliotis]|uniref:Fructokinase n=1 Tax=Shimia haliotis TaxID=1280847 RepID=A0A1I4HL42_9RHOB|nr:carbohydrate kinase [Shimia haliotis]SFL42480.1 fructokinase [Shimia haliotis]
MILCCGEALIDLIPSPTVSGEAGFVPHSGGAVFNTAISLGRLGAGAGLLSGLSSDLFGQQLLRDLQASHVDTSHLVISHRPTTLAFVHLSDGQATYSFFDENSAGRMLQVTDFPEISPEVSVLYFGGISLACEPGADAYAALAKQGKDDKVIVLDPNIRTGFIGDEARFRARLNLMLSCADIVKVSDEDLHWMFPGDDPVDQKISRILSEGAKLAILTEGGDGASAWTATGQTAQVPVTPVQVVDTVGAGDTFNAGVLACLDKRSLLKKSTLGTLSHADLKATLSFGTKVAGVTVSRAGANSPWHHELEEALHAQ